MSRTRAALLRTALVVAVAGSLVATVAMPVRAQMPDLSQMTGRPLPSGDLPSGTVSVRVIRGALSINLPNIEVRLEGGPQLLSAKTDASGRATFANVPVGPTLRALAVVEGEGLVSQPFTMPSNGGVRMMLVAGLGANAGAADTSGAAGGAGTGTAGAPAAGAGGSGAPGASGGGAGSSSPAPSTTTPAQPGEVSLGGQSRFVIELTDGAVEVYTLLELANLAATPVMPASPIVLEMPAAATGTTVLEGSTPQAKADGRKVTITGPFTSGTTPVQIAYRYPYDGDTIQIAQVLPLRLTQTTVIVRKIGGLQVQLAGMTGQRDVPLEGRIYHVVNAAGIDAGGRMELTLSGLPHQASWPPYLTLALGALIVVGGILMLLRPDAAQSDEESTWRALRTRRATLFDQLVALERRRVGRLRDDPRLAARREELLSQLEELDDRLAEAPPAQADAVGASRTGQAAQASASAAGEKPAHARSGNV